MDIREKVPAKDYHAGTELSASGLKWLSKGLGFYKAYVTGQIKPENADALEFGTMFHLGMEGCLSDFYVKEPDEKIDRRTKEGKAAWIDYLAYAKGRKIASKEDWEKVFAMVYSVSTNRDYTFLFSQKIIREASVYWTENGVDCRCRPDWWDRENGIVIDYKTTTDADEYNFGWTIRRLKYDLAAAHYIAGTDCTKYGWLAVEKSPPYATMLYWADMDDLKEAILKREALIRDLSFHQEWEEMSDWPKGYGQSIKTIKLPRYIP